MVDCKPESFLGHINSALPIIPFKGSIDDFELPRLANYLIKLSRETNFQEAHSKIFKLAEISEAESLKDVISLFSKHSK
jgi:hypothetical protein